MKKRWERLIAAVMSVVMVQTVCPPQAMALAASEVKEAAEYLEIDQLFSATQSAVTTDSPENVETQTSAALFQDGAVRIYHALQLYAIGSNAVVHSGDAQAETFGTGTVLTDDNGQVLLYDSDGSYQLMNDIPLPEGTTWTLPSGFSGTFVSEGESTEAPLYDEDTDTIYIYNNYQLLTRAAEDELKTVLSGDNVAETFGLGQVVYAGDQQLEYTQEHNYVVAQSFTGEMPELKAEEVLQEGTSWDGRQYEGQVIYYEKGVQYILIGNKQQLQAIGKTVSEWDGLVNGYKDVPIKVTEPIWKQERKFDGLVLGKWEDIGSPVMCYPGDADLAEGATLFEESDYGYEIGEDTGIRVHGDIGYKYRGSQKNQDGTIGYDETAKNNINIEQWSGDAPAYTTDANYIIFRGISLEGETWTPLMFSGNMEGRLNMKIETQATISRISVSCSGELDMTKSQGVGFFATITNERSKADLGLSAGQVSVKNLILDDITVDNRYSGLKDQHSLINDLLVVLGGVLGGVGDLVGGLINLIIPGSSNMKLGDLLEDLLSAQQESPDTFATGAFAGRIIGDVLVKDCAVKNASVKSDYNMTGGFAGNIEGLTEYDGLSERLGDALETIEKILNVIPFLGLGDLVKVLLDNPSLLEVKELIPSGYKQAIIQNCSVTMSSDASTIGKADTTFSGGFAGCQTGSNINGCTVSGLTGVTAKKYAGGFAGATRDAVIKGLLENLDVSLFNFDPSSVTDGCRVTGTTLKISSGAYAGGFTGIVANSDIKDSGVAGLDEVKTDKSTGATKDYTPTGLYAGGFAGRATLGSSVILVGEGDIADKGLLGTVTKLLVEILKGDDDPSALLNVLGVSPSTLHGCSVNGTAWSVSAEDYAGGLIGRGEGVQVGTGANDSTNSVANVEEVSSQGDYAGGIAGQLVPANAGGVVDSVLGIAAVKQYQLSYVSVAGSGKGLTVTAQGKYAGGAIGVSVGGTISNVNVNILKKVSAVETAGGFLGSNSAAGLLGSNGLDLLGWGVVKVENLLSAVNYFLTNCTNCYVSYRNVDKVEGTENMEQAAEPQVTANSAGGFIGEMYGGSLDNSYMPSPLIESAEGENASDAVRNVSYIKGTYYAGGFAGKISSGSLVDGVNGIDLAGLTVSVTELLKVLGVYTPKITCAGVSSGANGLRVEATQQKTNADGTNGDADSGSAGGYAGLIRGTHITQSSVSSLATKTDFAHDEPETVDWAVTAPNNAGGYAGQIDVGSVTAAGDGVNVTDIVNVDDLLGVLDVVESHLDRCDVEGMPGGFNVKSSTGSAGGYAGEINGVWMNGCDVDNYEYIEGVVSAGGYVGTAQPGDMASLLDEATVLDELIGVDGLLSVAQTFIPRIYNCSTAAVPCGGYVKATGTTEIIKPDDSETSQPESGTDAGTEEEQKVDLSGYIRTLRGMAGGYVGYNLGGRIWGNVVNDPADLSESPATLADQKLAATKRVREVDGKEYAGGFTGLMAAANIADTGGLSLLYGLVNTSNLLSALQAVYPTETNTKTTGPLRGLDEETWNAWVKAVGSSGVYGAELTNASYANIGKYIYGYTVTAKAQDNGTGVTDGGAAGGYVGRMETGVITNAYAQDVKLVTAYRSSGGFAGEMDTGTVANIGEVSLAGITVTDGLGLVKTFVPVIYSSRVDGYQSGMSIEATGETDTDAIGNAGGFVGACYGGQIWDEIPADEDLTFEPVTDQAGEVGYLKRVSGARYAGGFAGVMNSGSVAQLDTESESGLLNLILKQLIHSTTDTITSLANVLNATVPTVKSAAVNAPEKDGMTMDYVVEDASCAAGGFVGMACGAVLGHRDETSSSTSLTVYGLRAVMGDEHVGGFCGLAEMGGAAQVANEETSILELIRLANVDVLNILRTYFYDCYVKASSQGLSVYAMKASDTGGSTTDESDANQVYRTGNAGGFCGSLLNATVFRSHVDGLKLVRGINYVGGFAGLSGKSGVVDVDKLDLFGTDRFLVAAIGVLDVFGSRADECTVKGMSGGYTISAIGGEDTIAGGFIGYGDLSRVTNCDVEELKQVYSDQQAGGFVGRTSFAYLAKIDGMSLELLNPILLLINTLLKALYVDNLENINLADITIPGVLEIEVLNDGGVLKVDLMGLVISVALVKDNNGTNDVAQIHIGDSYVEISCSEDGITQDNLKIGLIKANRTKVSDCTVTGVTNGYDVFGGGATNEKDGSGEFGYAGGFVGFNNEGLLENNTMYLADTIRGTILYQNDGMEKIAVGLVGPFSGGTKLDTKYEEINNLKKIEGENNHYFVYRFNDAKDPLNSIVNGTTKLNVVAPQSQEIIQAYVAAESSDKPYDIYAIWHRGADVVQNGTSYFQQVWENANLSDNVYTNALFPANVYVSAGQANLMFGTPTEQNRDTTVPQGGAMQDPCSGDIHLTIEKIWYDNKNWSGEQRDPITVTLYQDGVAIDVKASQQLNTATNEDKSFQMDATMAGMDANIWTYEVDVPVATDGVTHTYSVIEEPIAGYVTFYYSTEDDPYTLYILNFQISELMANDTVVIDYGLPVAVDVLDNDALGPYQIAGELAGVATFDEAHLHQTFSDTTRTFEKLDLTYGTAVTNKDENMKDTLGEELYNKLLNVEGETSETDGGSKRDVYYVPNTMEMESLERMLYVVELDHRYVKNDQNYITGQLTIIPATEIFYEDNFEAIQYVDSGDVNTETGVGQWKTLQTDEGTTAAQQDTDRPGSAELERLWDDWYGNDTHYENDLTYSNGTTHYVTVDESIDSVEQSPKAIFEFTGTGFDVISVTSGATGTVKINVYQGEKKVRGYTVDSYYGYNYVDGEWVVDTSATAENALYQVPLLKVMDLPWGSYRAEIIPVYHASYDNQYEEGGKNEYDLYLDAIRIHSPVNSSRTDEDYKEIEGVYTQDGENKPDYTEIRDLLLNANNTSELDNIGVVFIDGNGELNDIKDYEAYGPKNEVYLAPGQAISFNLWTDEKPDKVQLAAKLEMGDSTNLTIAIAVPTNDEQKWQAFRSQTYEVKTAYDLYYDFGSLCIWDSVDGGEYAYKTRYPIVIMNNSQESQVIEDVSVSPAPSQGLDDVTDNLLSLTNLQWTGRYELESDDGVKTFALNEGNGKTTELVATASKTNVEAAYYLLNPVPQYTVTVKYQDEQGNSLAGDQKLQVYEGAEYDASQLVEENIKGYQFQQINGSVTGVATGNVEIIVVYQKLSMDTLQQLMDRANDMVNHAHKYVDTHWQILLDAMEYAKKLLDMDGVTQEDVDEAANTLLEAILAQRFQANKENLEAILGKAEAVELSGYTAESVATFRTALATAQAVLADDSLSEEDQHIVDAAVDALESAMDGLTAETEEEPEATDTPLPTDEPQATEEPQITDKPQATEKPQVTSEPQESAEQNAQVPQTGDGSGLTIWLTTLFICAAAGIGMGMKVKTREDEEQ